jgi:predicted HTH transcriptional regulator
MKKTAFEQPSNDRGTTTRDTNLMIKSNRASIRKVKAIEKSKSPRKIKHPNRTFMMKAITTMLESRSEQAGKTDPLVGAVLVGGDGKIIGHAHRGKYGSGDHGEFTLLEKSGLKIPKNAVLYVTLEPCTKRGDRKTPCADRVVSSGIKHVVIGIPDPNPDIFGKGSQKLRNAGIKVDNFDPDLAEQVRTHNKEFIEEQERRTARQSSPIKSPDRHENLPLYEASLHDLSEDAINLYLNKTSKRFKVPSPELWEDFRKSGFVAEGRTKKELRPTVAGMVLFGRQPHQFLPQARIKADRFSVAADEPALIERVLAQKDITGPLFQQVESILEFFNINVRRVPRIRGAQREEVPEYPETVIREVIVNALVHRDYQAGAHTYFSMFRDQIIVKSPGLPVEPLTIEMFPDKVASIQRNPKTAQAAFSLGIMEARGYGIKHMPERLRAHQLQAPEFSLKNGFFIVNLPGRERTPFAIRADSQLLATLSPRQLEIVQLAESKKIIRSEDVVAIIKVSKETATQDLRRLIELGVLAKSGTARSTAYFLAVL